MTVKPPPSPVSTKADGAGCVCVELNIRGLRPVGVKEQAGARPGWKEVVPPLDVQPCSFVHRHVVVERGNCGTKINQTPQEDAASWDHLAGERQLADERQQFSLSTGATVVESGELVPKFTFTFGRDTRLHTN